MKISKFTDKLNEKIDSDDVSGNDKIPDITGRRGSPVIAIAVSRDGKYVASSDGRIHVWDFTSGNRIRSFYSPVKISSLSFTDNNKILVAGNFNGDIQVWDIETGKIIRAFIN